MADPSTGSALAVATELLGLRPVDAGRGPAAAHFGVVRFRGRERFLVPLGWPAATRASCLAYVGLRSPSTRVSRRLVAEGLRRGALRPGGRSASVEHHQGDAGAEGLSSHLAAALGQPEVAVAMGLGTVDAVWKPTLQVFTPDGSPLAFVKVGRGPVAAELVSREAEALARWAEHPDPRLVVPGLLGTTTWRGLPMVLVAPLPADARRLPAPVSPWPVRALDGPVPDTPLDRAPWWTTRRAIAGAGDTAADGELDALLSRIEARHGGTPRPWARWHGDWVPWNLARCHLGLVAWDWEYSEPGAPVGLDEVHGRYQQLRVGQARPVAEALAGAGASAPSPWTADAHLAMLLTRNAELVRLGGAVPGDDAEIRRFAAAALR